MHREFKATSARLQVRRNAWLGAYVGGRGAP